MEENLEITNLMVCSSGAGYYVGRYCNEGPYSRDSQYFATKEEANNHLKLINS